MKPQRVILVERNRREFSTDYFSSFPAANARQADSYFGLPLGWYFKAAGSGEIGMVAVRQRGALHGVRLVLPIRFASISAARGADDTGSARICDDRPRVNVDRFGAHLSF